MSDLLLVNIAEIFSLTEKKALDVGGSRCISAPKQGQGFDFEMLCEGFSASLAGALDKQGRRVFGPVKDCFTPI
jgi:hypothetical protein